MKIKPLVIVIVLISVVFIFGIISIIKAPQKGISVKEITKEEVSVVKKSKFKPAPEFALTDVSGAIRKLSDFRNKVVILDFFATWCPPCREEIPHFIDLYTSYKDQGLEIIGVALDWNSDRVVPAFSRENGINYTVLLGNKNVSDLYGGIDAIPTTFILDREGNIRKKYIGYNAKEVFESYIKELL